VKGECKERAGAKEVVEGTVRSVDDVPLIAVCHGSPASWTWAGGDDSDSVAIMLGAPTSRGYLAKVELRNSDCRALDFVVTFGITTFYSVAEINEALAELLW
jgi:hypothetical protein